MRSKLSDAKEVMKAIGEGDEDWSLQQERIGNRAIISRWFSDLSQGFEKEVKK